MIKNLIKIVVGIMMIASVLVGYIPNLEYSIELTCISNMIGGVILLVDGIRGILKKPGCLNIIRLNVTVCILIVFIISLGSLCGAYKFNFAGAFFFLHVVNPLVFLACYIFGADARNDGFWTIFIAPAMFILYLLFDYVRYLYTGKLVYGLMAVEDFTLIDFLIAFVIVYAFAIVVALVPFSLNQLICKERI